MTDPDEFWAEVRRRLPDVDILVLPPQPPAPPATTDSRLVAAIRARQAREAAHATLAELWSRLAGGLPRPATVQRIWRSVAPDTGVLRLEVVARHDGQPAAGIAAVLAAARRSVEEAGGTVDEQHWAASDGLRLVIELAGHDVELYGTTDPPGLTVTVLSPPVAVPPELAQELIATMTEEVPL